MGINRNLALRVLCIFVGATIVPLVIARQEPSVWDGIYSQAQADRGQALYTKACASCHRANLVSRGQTPSLSGSGFLEKWDGQTLGDLFEKMQTSMPADHPGSLSREENAAVLAFILRFNEFPSGDTDLRTDADWLATVRFKAAKSK
ncbi:MAG: cytochrome c [Bryobacteraceae bacterium]